MKNISNDFQEHLDNECTTICNCWQIARLDGVVLGFTDHDRDLEFEGVAHEAVTGFQSSMIEESLGLSPDAQDILGALSSASISEVDIENNLYDGAKLKQFIVNWQSPSQRVLMRTLLLDEISRQDGVFKASVKSLSAELDQTNMRRFQKRCSADLGDTNCKIDLASNYSKIATVEKISNSTVQTSLPEQYPQSWFNGGKLKFLSGANEGTILEIAKHFKLDHESNHFSLEFWTSAPQEVSIGDSILITPGCDKSFTTCLEKFSNHTNFRGFPHMPDAEFAMSYASNASEMDGGPLYKKIT